MRENLTSHPAIVIGGGPAGSAAATRLAEAGKPVTLFERSAGPADKVCGEFISWEAADYLERLEISPAALGAAKIERLRLFNGLETIEAALPFPGWSLSRRILDETLLARAASAGASIRRGIQVTGALPQRQGWQATVSGGETVSAETVFLATGKHELRGWRRQKRSGKALIGFKMHFRLSRQQSRRLARHVEIFLFDGGYAGLEPVENGAVNFCFLIDRRIYAACGKDWDTLLGLLQLKAPALGERLKDAVPLFARPLSVFNMPYGFVGAAMTPLPAFFRLGDQIAVIHSFAGDGLAMALHSSFVASSAYLSGHDSAAYQKAVRRTLRRPVCNAQLLATLAATAPGRSGLFTLLRWMPGLVTSAIHATRLPSDIGG